MSITQPHVDELLISSAAADCVSLMNVMKKREERDNQRDFPTEREET
jgi:hypothetical protein